MEVIKGYKNIHSAFKKPVLTIGNYDGLHLGHQKIIQEVIDRAKAEGGTSIVYTFRPHPQRALLPSQKFQLINTYDEKLELLNDFGLDVVIEEPFSRQFSTITPEIFFREVLIKRLSALAIYVGYDFGFGKNRAGNLNVLKGFCDEEKVELHISPPEQIDGETCSSSRIRDYIRCGEIQKANQLLGREFFYRGLVVKGQGRGKKIGFATANVFTESKLQVKEGVYATIALFKGQKFQSVTNVGRQPTFNEGNTSPVVVETHILNFNEDIYGETLEVRMIERIRDEVRFSGVDELVKQIQKDVESATKATRHFLPN